MATRITRWRPDTCSCIIEYQWDDAQSEDVRTHSVSKIIEACPAHSGEPTESGHYTKVVAENALKNKSLTELLKNFTKLGYERFDSKGNSLGLVLKDGIASWSFDAQRVLHLQIPALSTLEKTSAQTAVDTLLGASKVVLD